MQIPDQIKDMAIDIFRKMPIYDELKKDFEEVRKYQEALCVLANDAEDTKLNIVRVGTILSFSIIGKIIHGKYPKDFSANDWRDIADNVHDYGIMMEGNRYTEFVFNLLAVYIDFSVDINEESVSGQAASEIRGLAEDIRVATYKLDRGLISEPDYVDDCLWICLEAMIKLIAAYKTVGLCREYADFIRAVADISVQYGRFKLYQKELSLVDEYLERQKVLDEEQERKLQQYLDELKAEQDEFNDLIDHAFSDDFENMLKNSVSLARKAGVDESRILSSTAKIDSYFTD